MRVSYLQQSSLFTTAPSSSRGGRARTHASEHRQTLISTKASTRTDSLHTEPGLYLRYTRCTVYRTAVRRKASHVSHVRKSGSTREENANTQLRFSGHRCHHLARTYYHLHTAVRLTKSSLHRTRPSSPWTPRLPSLAGVTRLSLSGLGVLVIAPHF